MSRKYSIEELDQMRRSIFPLHRRDIVCASVENRATIIEEFLRTYMVNGTEPEELKASAEAKAKEREAREAARRLEPQSSGK